MGVGYQRHALAALPWKKTKYPLCKRLGGFQDRSGWVRKISLLQGFDLRTVHLVPNCYIDYVIPAHIYYTRVGTLIVATIYLQLIQNRYMFRSFTVLQCSHQHCLQPVASDVEVVGYL